LAGICEKDYTDILYSYIIVTPISFSTHISLTTSHGSAVARPSRWPYCDAV